MSHQQQPPSEEDSNMEDAITLRDHRTFLAQSQPRRPERTRDLPITSLWDATGTGALPTQRRLRDYRERSPYTTPIRESSFTQRLSRIGAGQESSDEEDLPATVRREVRRQGTEVVQGLSQGISELTARTQYMSLIEDLLFRHEARIAEITQNNSVLVKDLQDKFRESDEAQARLMGTLGEIDSRFQAQAGAQATQLNELFTHLTTTAATQQAQQGERINALANYVQQMKAATPSIKIPPELTQTLNEIKENGARNKDQLEREQEEARRLVAQSQKDLQEFLGKLKAAAGLKDKGKRPAVETEEEISSHHGEESRASSSHPGPETSGGQGGQGLGGNGGGGRPRGPGGSIPDPSDSSSSDEGSRKRRRRRAGKRQPNFAPPTPAKGETPKQAKIPFAGKPDQDVRHWIDQMEILMELQPKVKWDDKTRILWASLELQGSATSFWRNFKERLGVEPELGTWRNFKRELKIQYGNRTSQEQAKQRMDRLRQTGPIDDYLNEMQNLEWDARVGPVVMKSMILTGINSSVERRISAAIEEPYDFPDWLAWVRKVGRKDAEVKARHEILRGRENPRSQDTTSPAARKQNTPRPQNYPLRASEKKPDSNTRQRPTDDLGATQEEKQKWEREKKCFRCGRDNHRAKDCFATSKVRLTQPSRPSQKRRRDPSGEKDPGEGSEKKKRLGTQGEAFRARITSLED